MSTLLLVGGTTKMAGSLVGYGMCLGIGFWISKKITNKIDEKLCMYDKRFLAQLEKEMHLDQTTR